MYLGGSGVVGEDLYLGGSGIVGVGHVLRVFWCSRCRACT